MSVDSRKSSAVLLLVPFEPATSLGLLADAQYRRTAGAFINMPLAQAMEEVNQLIGRSLNLKNPEDRPIFGGRPWEFPVHRSLTAVALATDLERNGISWEAIDPGSQELEYWRRTLERAREAPPKIVAISTTFVVSLAWIRTLVALVRKNLPYAKLVIGGYFYAVKATDFLSLDGDVLVVGEGEVRFAEIVKRLLDGRPLDDVPGIYFPRGDGTLHHTGHAEPIGLARLPPADWRLAARMEPRVDLDHDMLDCAVETQRGCIFKCEFCTFRTLQSPDLLSPEAAVEAILGPSRAMKGGFVNLTDATATFPHQRWTDILHLLKAHPGPKPPLWAFARVSDINEENARLMVEAGVRELFIGQESGDQRILNAMKKGTKLDQVKPAIRALGPHDIRVYLGLIHGFPGETAESVEATRSLVTTINDGFEKRPVVPIYKVDPFVLLEFASVSQTDEMKAADHYLGYRSGEYSGRRASEEVLATLIAASRVPHAPAFIYLFHAAQPPSMGSSHAVFGGSGDPLATFRWFKAVERGVAIFLERDLDGKKPNDAELARVRAAILEHYRPRKSIKDTISALQSRARARMFSTLAKEWASEETRGTGLLTRLLLGAKTAQDTRDHQRALLAIQTGTYISPGVSGERDSTPLASSLVSDTMVRAKKHKLPVIKTSAGAAADSSSS